MDGLDTLIISSKPFQFSLQFGNNHSMKNLSSSKLLSFSTVSTAPSGQNNLYVHHQLNCLLTDLEDPTCYFLLNKLNFPYRIRTSFPFIQGHMTKSANPCLRIDSASDPRTEIPNSMALHIRTQPGLGIRALTWLATAVAVVCMKAWYPLHTQRKAIGKSSHWARKLSRYYVSLSMLFRPPSSLLK